jgi:hypothetical protein
MNIIVLRKDWIESEKTEVYPIVLIRSQILDT